MSKYFSVTVFNKMIARMGSVLFLVIFVYLKNNSMVFAMDSNEKNTSSLLWQYAQRDQTFFELKALIEKSNVDINSRNTKQQTILHIAATHGAESIVSYLLDLKNDQFSKPSSSYENNLNNLKIKIDAQDEYGYTALHFAIINSHLNLARMLIKAGAKLNVTEESCWHALYFTAQYAKDKGFVKFIIEESQKTQFDIDTPGEGDETDSGNADFGFHLLIEYIEESPLTIAIRKGNRAAREALLEARAKLDIDECFFEGVSLEEVI